MGGRWQRGMKTSITTIVWGKMHTLAELREVLAEVRRIEYDGVGLETRLLPREAIQNPRLVRKTLEESGVENAGSYSTMKLQDVAWASEAGTPLLWVVARGTGNTKLSGRSHSSARWRRSRGLRWRSTTTWGRVSRPRPRGRSRPGAPPPSPSCRLRRPLRPSDQKPQARRML